MLVRNVCTYTLCTVSSVQMTNKIKNWRKEVIEFDNCNLKI